MSLRERGPAKANGGPPAKLAALVDHDGYDPPPVPDWDGAPAEWLALKWAVDCGQVSFHDVATAWARSHWGPDGDRASTGEEQRHWAEIFPSLLHVFGEQRGGLITCYFCENIRVAAALTDIWTAADHGDGPVKSVGRQRRDAALHREVLEEASHSRQRKVVERAFTETSRPFRESAANTAIHVEPTFGDPDSPRAKELLFRCLRVHYQAIEWLRPKPRKICTRMTFNVIANLLGTLDARVGAGGPAAAAEFDNQHADQEVLEREIQKTEEYFHTSAQRYARLTYMIGMLLGVFVAAVAALLLVVLPMVPSRLGLVFIAGALGAIVSVLQRLTSGRLFVTVEDGPGTLMLLGALRPLLGGLLGMALYAFVKAGIFVALTPPRGGTVDEPYFVAALGFLAGFSERFAKDSLDPTKLLAASASRSGTITPPLRPPGGR
jgi:hypothetical protein